MIDFKHFTGEQLLEQESQTLEQMNTVAFSHDFLEKENILQYLDHEHQIICMYKDEDLVAFSWVLLCESAKAADLCWFVAHKDKVKGLESKLLLDKTLEFCKQHEITQVEFNCAPQSWGRLKDKKRLLRKFGYKLTEYEFNFDISIDI